jgi:4,5-dihydroxyphthalate decarboxylase
LRRAADGHNAMKKLVLSMSCCNYDRTAALFDGRVQVEGVDLVSSQLEPEESFHRAFKFEEFDISEISLSSHTMMTSRGANAYVAIPAFVSRLFRHSGIYIRTDRGIKSPADLAGKKVGLPEYQITANVWIRGILQDDYGLAPASVHWRRGGVEEAGREERAALSLPPDVDLQQVPEGKTLSGMLAAGELDAVISARAPSCFLRGDKGVDRMFPNYPEVEGEYFKRTRIFPTMHVIGIRKELAQQHPWLAVNVFKAFIRAKELAFHEMGQIGHLFHSLPWGVAAYEQAKKELGADYWSYGFAPNRHVLETFTRYHHKQGLSSRLVDPAELFVPASRELTLI